MEPGSTSNSKHDPLHSLLQDHVMASIDNAAVQPVHKAHHTMACAANRASLLEHHWISHTKGSSPAHDIRKKQIVSQMRTEQLWRADAVTHPNNPGLDVRKPQERMVNLCRARQPGMRWGKPALVRTQHQFKGVAEGPILGRWQVMPVLRSPHSPGCHVQITKAMQI